MKKREHTKLQSYPDRKNGPSDSSGFHIYWLEASSRLEDEFFTIREQPAVTTLEENLSSKFCIIEIEGNKQSSFLLSLAFLELV